MSPVVAVVAPVLPQVLVSVAVVEAAQELEMVSVAVVEAAGGRQIEAVQELVSVAQEARILLHCSPSQLDT